MEDRLTELEIRLALQDELLDELNRVVARQQQDLELLAQALRQVQEQQRSGPGAPRSLFDEIPPHY
ncbi:SlyX family protein [Jeongeupia sp. USM3]|uniref:SlyX family protein n=1 Tax=Jeongeupia sp. USM3 TaxID=1906741 RepID=UPI00089DDBF6|nr:SlyX family protein [Jeongeupia sp. USM3]AOY01178.1 SlyX protein [Jeongeupia sp. USM3]